MLANMSQTSYLCVYYLKRYKNDAKETRKQAANLRPFLPDEAFRLKNALFLPVVCSFPAEECV
jgi:hypothetical protein